MKGSGGCLKSHATIPLLKVGAGDVPVGTNAAVMAADTADQSHLVVYTKSSLGEQSTPVAAGASDADVGTSSVAFTDADLDADEVAGLITWAPTGDEDLVGAYLVHLAESDAGAARSQVSGDVPGGTNALLMPMDTPEESFTHVVVYAESSFVEQTTPAGVVALVDKASTVGSLAFPDDDLVLLLLLLLLLV